MSDRVASAVVQPAVLGRRRNPARAVLRFAAHRPVAVICILVLGALVTVGLLAPWLAPADPLRPSTARLQAPSTAHWAGTDDLGRDLASRLMYGARTSITTGLCVSLATSAVGLLLGSVSGFFGGRVDLIMQRFVDALQAIPALVVAMVLVVMVGPKTWHGVPLTVVIALTGVFVPSSTRVVRGAALAIAALPFVEAARSLGATNSRILFRYIMPNVLAPLLVVATVQLGAVITAEASLSYLGIGTPPPTPSWGAMLGGNARKFVEQAPWLVLAPGLCLTAAVLAFNLLGDEIRDLTDPRLRKGGR